MKYPVIVIAFLLLAVIAVGCGRASVPEPAPDPETAEVQPDPAPPVAAENAEEPNAPAAEPSGEPAGSGDPSGGPGGAGAYANAVSAFAEENKTAVKGQIVLAGSSLMEKFPIHKIMEERGIDTIVYNRGIGGSVTTQLLADIDTIILDLEPSKLFINIGTNDLDSNEEDYIGILMENYRKIIETVQNALPDCEIYFLSYYPPAENFNMPKPGVKHMRTLEDIQECNRLLEVMAAEMGCEYIDLTPYVSREDGYMKDEYSLDGLHMVDEAYEQLFDELYKYF